jgi:hypothetical protein
MCTPVALGVVGIVGGLAQGVGAYQQQMTNAANSTMQANGLTRDIEAERAASSYEIARTRETVAKTLGNARAGFAANGLALDGSAAEVLQDTATEGALDIAAIRWNSDVKVGNLGYARDVAKSNAAASKAAAPLAFITPVIGSVAKFGGSFG